MDRHEETVNKGKALFNPYVAECNKLANDVKERHTETVNSVRQSYSFVSSYVRDLSFSSAELVEANVKSLKEEIAKQEAARFSTILLELETKLRAMTDSPEGIAVLTYVVDRYDELRGSAQIVDEMSSPSKKLDETINKNVANWKKVLSSAPILKLIHKGNVDRAKASLKRDKEKLQIAEKGILDTEKAISEKEGAYKEDLIAKVKEITDELLGLNNKIENLYAALAKEEDSALDQKYQAGSSKKYLNKAQRVAADIEHVEKIEPIKKELAQALKELSRLRRNWLSEAKEPSDHIDALYDELNMHQNNKHEALIGIHANENVLKELEG